VVWPPSGLAERANRVMKAMMEMDKIDIAALNKAAISPTA
jgi:hypothetical protein